MKKEVKTARASDGGWGIAAFVFGILSILFSLLSPLLGLLFGIMGVVGSRVQKRRGTSKLSHAGFVLSITGIILSILLFVLLALYLQNNPDFLANLQNAGTLQ